MDSESHVDPRDRPLYPTPEEIEAWAAREHARRAAWLAGPSEDEKLDWARRYRWRAAMGLEESRLGPTPEESDAWAAREHQRRAAWLAGPTDAEKQHWAARQQRRAGADVADAPPAPAEADVAAWAAREQQRRREWLGGPSEDEKQRWAQRQAGGWLDDLMDLPAMLQSEAAQRLLREAELAGKGTLHALSRAPLALWSYVVRAGRALEDEFYQTPRRRRVPY